MKQKAEEKEEPMHVPSTDEIAEMLSPIQEIASNLALYIALGHLYKAKQEFCAPMQGAPKGGK